MKHNISWDQRLAVRWAVGALFWFLAGLSAVASAGPAADIPAQPLAQALAAFADSAHLHLVYLSQLALNKISQPVPGGLATRDGLARLLDGTGLTYSFLDNDTITIRELSAADRPDRNDQAVLREVVVSAMKREELLSSVPMSISVLSADRLQESGINDIRGIAAVTPGVEFDFSSQFGPGILSDVVIRGISAKKGDATTGVYINDTPIQMPHSVFNNPYPVTFDLARVEVLRGPQGVLFGRSAEGGAMRYITNEPSTTTTSELYSSEMSTTEHGGVNVEAGAAAGGPLIAEVLGGRISAWYRRDAGYVDRVDPFSDARVDADSNHFASKMLRLALEIEPEDHLRIQPGFTYQSVALHDTPIFFADQSDPGSGDFNNGKLLEQPSIDKFWMGSLQMTARLGDANLTVVTSYFDRYAAATVDQTNVAGVDYFGGFGNPLGPEYPTSYSDAVPSLLTQRWIQESAEARIASATLSAPLAWLAGVFYSRLGRSSTKDTYAITAPQVPGILTDEDDVTREVSIFGYGQLSLPWRWSLGGGVRVGWAQAVGSARNGGFANTGAPAFASDGSHEALPPAPRFDVSYHLDSNHLLYAAAARGVRIGGINGGPQPIVCAGVTEPARFAPDFVWSVELGSKNHLFADRLQINTSLFDIHWQKIQEPYVDACGNSLTTNAGAARNFGFDLDVEALVTERLHMTLAIGMLDARYSRDVSDADGETIIDKGAVVGGVPSVPSPWDGTFTARYQRPLFSNLDGYVRTELIVHSHNPGPFTELDPKSTNYYPGLRADPATVLLNLQLGMTWGASDLTLFVDNVLDSHPELQTDADAPGSSLLYAYTLRPRTIGVRANWRFK